MLLTFLLSKPLSLNSVDLKALVHTKCAPPPLTRVQLLVSKQGCVRPRPRRGGRIRPRLTDRRTRHRPLVPFSWLSFAEGGPPAGGLLKLNNKIVECRFDPVRCPHRTARETAVAYSERAHTGG